MNADEIDDRVLCPDGACTGLLDTDNVCGTCHQRAPTDTTNSPRPDAPPTDAPPTDAPPTDAPPTDAPPTDALDPDERIPCDDGTCVGLIGFEGVCGTCGRRST